MASSERIIFVSNVKIGPKSRNTEKLVGTSLGIGV